LLAICGFGSAQSVSLAGKRLTVDQPDLKRTIPVQIAEGVEGESYVATNSGRSIYVTVVDGTAWAVLDPNSDAGVKEYKLSQVAKRSDQRVRLVKKDDADAIDVLVQDGLLTTYHYSNEARKPYLWPVKGERGVSVTRDYPMAETGETKDHPHHVSFWTGFGDINGHDYWEYGERTGWQRTESIEFGSGDACGWIVTHIVWEDKEHKPVIDEHRVFRFYADAGKTGARLFDVDIVFTAAYGDVKFGDTKEGGIVGLRIADALRARGGSGTITLSTGITNAETWGKPAAWCDYSGTIEGVGARGITVFDSPASFRHPSHWHVRDYGLLGANPFGYSHFYNGEKNGDHTVKNGEILSFSYRIYVHSGDVTEADVAGYWEDFANPPKVTIK
jgi:hypothetical protein